MQNFLAHLLVYTKRLSRDVHLRNRPRKSWNRNFPPEIPRKLWQFWYHSKWFEKLYKLSHSKLRAIHWVRKYQNSWNSACIEQVCTNVNIRKWTWLRTMNQKPFLIFEYFIVILMPKLKHFVFEREYRRFFVKQISKNFGSNVFFIEIPFEWVL